MSDPRDEGEMRKTTTDFFDNGGIDRTECNEADKYVNENSTIGRTKSDLNNNSNADGDMFTANNLKQESERDNEGGTNLVSTVDGVNNVNSENASAEHSRDQHFIAGDEPTNDTVMQENAQANIHYKATRGHGSSPPYRHAIAGEERIDDCEQQNIQHNTENGILAKENLHNVDNETLPRDNLHTDQTDNETPPRKILHTDKDDSETPPTEILHTDKADNETLLREILHTDKDDNETPPTEIIHTDKDDNETPPREILHTDKADNETPPREILHTDKDDKETPLREILHTDKADNETPPREILHTHNDDNETPPREILHTDKADNETPPREILHTDKDDNETPLREILHTDKADNETPPREILHTDKDDNETPLTEILHTDKSDSETPPREILHTDKADNETPPREILHTDKDDNETPLREILHTDKADNETPPREILHTDKDDNEQPPREIIHTDKADNETPLTEILHTDQDDNEAPLREILHIDKADNETPPIENLYNAGNETNNFSQSPTVNLHITDNKTSPSAANEAETSHQQELNVEYIGQDAAELQKLVDKMDDKLMETGETLMERGNSYQESQVETDPKTVHSENSTDITNALLTTGPDSESIVNGEQRAKTLEEHGGNGTGKADTNQQSSKDETHDEHSQQHAGLKERDVRGGTNITMNEDKSRGVTVATTKDAHTSEMSVNQDKDVSTAHYIPAGGVSSLSTGKIPEHYDKEQTEKGIEKPLPEVDTTDIKENLQRKTHENVESEEIQNGTKHNYTNVNIHSNSDMEQNADVRHASRASEKSTYKTVGFIATSNIATPEKLESSQTDTEEIHNVNNVHDNDILKSKSEDTKTEETNVTTTYDNLYFTGRLPSLMSTHSSLHSVRNLDDKTERETSIAEEREYAIANHLSSTKLGQIDHSVEKNETSILQDTEHVLEYDGGDAKPDERRIPTASRKIRELINEVNMPSDNIYQLSREIPLTARSTVRRDRSATLSNTSEKTDVIDAIGEVRKENDPRKETSNIGSANMTVEDINIVTSKVMSTTHSKDFQSKFDDLQHMKNISDYVQDNLNVQPNTTSRDESTSSNKQEASKNNEDDTLRRTPKTKDYIRTKDTVDTRGEEHANLPDTGLSSERSINQQSKRSPQHSSQKSSRLKFPDRLADTDESLTPADKPVQRSSSDNDLKAIIASAKLVINNDTDTTESYRELETTDTSALTIQCDNISLAQRRPSSKDGAERKAKVTNVQLDSLETVSSLICSSCLQPNTDIHSAGYCTTCQKYLCGTCVTVHTVEKDTIFHEIVPSYCKNELTVNKYVQATGYCVDCATFLCMKCVIQHTGFRSNRHHRIIQSSYVSKPKDRKVVTKEFLDEVESKVSKTSTKGSSKEQKRKRMLLHDLDTSNPYRFPFSNVPESLYPGPHKKLAASYTKSPKWVHSSIPNLPYLVQPKPIPDRIFHKAGYPRPLMIYTNPKREFDTMAAKLKMLKSRYNVKGEKNMSSRKEQSVFTVRPKGRDNFSLPDIQSVNSQTSGGRSLKQINEQTTKYLQRKEVEFLSDHNMSIPFPRGEKRTEILAMTILLNGKLAIIDRMNNNIKLFNKAFNCTAALQFQNRLVDLCASNLCPTDIYAATPKHIYELSVEKGIELRRKIKVEIKRIEGLVHWKYGLVVVSKKTNITWELRLLDYRGNLKSKLEVFNPFTLDIESSPLHHMTSSKDGKCISLSDTKNSCIITVDVTSRIVLHETMLDGGKCPTYLASDGEGNHNVFASCDNKVFQISKNGKVLGALIDKAKEKEYIGCIVYNKSNGRLYVQTGKDIISVYQTYF